ncbi:phage putative head morphogenesis protein, SPP1 gp7 family [Thermoactinomyces sp. DSM 45891]|uniref:phage head morphogenesis protein n=1 Tax=Thermoactinomyces sp. DSM 45891 TaxID=1761907 RepID=UPI00091357B6|nr:phage minor head protein [Thermoactinomyces sp. DSM 45891]SFX83721.1 phage putative head morphogenesis protein, SPP1 gp7 family [Thermoactinomyces sp. DSM 45891]
MRAEKMLEEVTSFLSECGCLPAFKQVDKDLLEAEKKLEYQLWKLFVRVENRMISQLVSMGYIPQDPVRRLLFVEEFLKHLKDDLPKVVANNVTDSAKRGRIIAFDDLKENGISYSYSDFDSWTYGRLQDQSYTFSRATSERIIGDFSGNLAQSYKKGLGIEEASKELQREFDQIKEYRLKRIARTEINSAQNEGIFETLSEFGVRYKQWITARDRRVRGNKPKDKANHVMMHGEVVGLYERFSNGLFFPGDRFGEPREWIHCRCRIRPYLPKRGEVIVGDL